MRILLCLLFVVMASSIVLASRLCLPIGEHPPPIEYALNKVQDAIAQSASSLEINCSQPDYQLFYEVDNDYDSDDFILVVTDVELIITSGSARGIMYGLLHMLDQLGGLAWKIANLHSSVVEMKARVRAISLPQQFLAVGRQHVRDILDEMVWLRFNAVVLSKAANSEMIKDSDPLMTTIKPLCIERGLHMIRSFGSSRNGDHWSVKAIEGADKTLEVEDAPLDLKNEHEWLDLTHCEELDGDMATVLRAKWPKSGSYGTSRLKPYWDRACQQIPKDSLSIILDFPPIFGGVEPADQLMRDYRPYFTFWSGQMIRGDKISEANLWNRFTGSNDSCLGLRLEKNRQMVSALEECLQPEDSNLDLATMHLWRIDESVFADIFWFVQQVWKMERGDHSALRDYDEEVALDTNILEKLIARDDSASHLDHECNYQHPGLQRIVNHGLALGHLAQYVTEKWLAARELIQYGISRKRKHRQLAVDRLQRSKHAWSLYWDRAKDLPGLFSHDYSSQEDIIKEIDIEIAVVSKLKPGFLNGLTGSD